ncbi:MAG: proline dehydrogenase family protein [Thermaurantimonas sp.]|uniref:proline dehydrogenase family protein n=1 Tax=Thermaurantimonas sp. TaxID=2681568 RepID=UPI003919EF3E
MKPYDDPNLFENTEKAFRYRTDAELRRARWLFKLIENPSTVAWGKKMLALADKVKLPYQWAVKATVFRQFCGGETMQECISTIDRLYQYGVKSILDYSVEGKETEDDFEHTCLKIIEIIRFSKDKPAIPFAVFKMTGMGRFALLERISSGETLTPEELREWERVKARVHSICTEAATSDVPVMIDAEESWIQPAIDALAEEMMWEFNVHKPIVYTTLQMYRHDRFPYLKDLLLRARERERYVGVKIVRGAYMEKERERARQLGYTDPIQPDKASSDRDYDYALRLVVDNLSTFGLVAGTHNEESCRTLMRAMDDYRIPNNDPRIYFSQLYGMSDHLSFNLSALGYNVVKYVPFGPVRDVLPYLIRRAEENTSVAGQTGRELSLIQKELKRRNA